MSDGPTIRPAVVEDCDMLGLITVTASLSAFIGRVPERSLDLAWTPSDSASGWRRTLKGLPADDFFLVAEQDDQVIGFVWAGSSTRADQDEGEVKGLYVLPTVHRQGIGRQLLSEAVRQLRDRAMPSLLIGCIKENRSCGFYRHLGGIEAFRRPNTVDQFRTEEIFFLWTDTTPLI